MKIKELSEKLRPGKAALIFSEESILYLTGFAVSDAVLVVSKNGSTLVTDGRYIEAATEKIQSCEVVLGRTGDFKTQIKEIMSRYDVREVLLEISRVTVREAAKYRAYLDSFKMALTEELDDLMKALRSVKSEEERERIARAQSIAETGFERILPLIKPGIRERDIALELDYQMKKAGAQDISFETIVVTGVNSSKPHGVPGNTEIENGDFVTIDFGAVYEGYHSDTTRTLAVGSVSDEQRRVYDTVLKAQTAGVMALHAGISAKAADAVCRDIITDAGYGNFFTHSTGHGVGVEIHEFPALSPVANEQILLQSGNVVTVEPGIYIPGSFGVRIEDMLYVTEDGAENFVTLPKELMIL